MNNQNIVEELKAKRELENKVILECERVSGIDEFFILKKNLDKTKEVVEFLESEVSTKMTLFEESLSLEVYDCLFGTIKKEAKSTSNGTIKKEIASRVLNGEKIPNVASDLYPNRPLKSIKAHNGQKGCDGRNYLVFRQIQEAEKNGWIRIVEKATASDNYSTVKIEKLMDF